MRRSFVRVCGLRIRYQLGQDRGCQLKLTTEWNTFRERLMGMGFPETA